MKTRIDEYNWHEIQKFHNDGHYLAEICKFFNVSPKTINVALKRGKFIKNILPPYKHSAETKNKLSEIKKKWLKDNPDKHVWKRRNKHDSVPCNCFKDKLKENKISFFPEYEPLENYSYSIDVAFPCDKFGIEINGNQHYDKNGKLKPYYQKRHDLIISNGWILEEIPCAMVWNEEFVNKIICSLKDKINSSFNYDEWVEKYIKEKKAKQNKCCIVCGNKISRKADKCRKCANIRIHTRKVERPEKEELEKLIKDLSLVKIGERFGVSDNSIKQWCKDYGIELGRRWGFRMK